MKQSEIKKCCGCGKGVMHNNPLMFYTVTMSTQAVNHGALQRQTGLEMMIGHAGIAAVMGPNENISEEIDRTEELWVCMDCASFKPIHELIPEVD